MKAHLGVKIDPTCTTIFQVGNKKRNSSDLMSQKHNCFMRNTWNMKIVQLVVLRVLKIKNPVYCKNSLILIGVFFDSIHERV